MTKLTPRERRYQKTKKAILETAQELVAEKGPEGLSIREIARRIDYSPAGLYEYYESKDEIIAAIVQAGMAGLNTTFAEISPDLPPSQRLVDLSVAYVNFAIHNPEQFLLIFNTIPSKRMSLEEVNLESSFYTVLLETIRAAVEAGEIKVNGDYAAQGIAFNLWALMHGRAMLQLTFLRNFQADFEAAHRWAIELFIKGLNAD
ncbi:MAG: TetR/AcrR family transcriptional regulator [Chloroflexota bacterium]